MLDLEFVKLETLNKCPERSFKGSNCQARAYLCLEKRSRALRLFSKAQAGSDFVGFEQD
jgi:hypothetical protein